VNSWANPW